ncbi:MAG: type IV secretion system DNA-binding domain-containing protein [Candidatus Falkowbacteria bacterium]
MKDIAVFAQTTYRNEFKKFGIKTDDRRRHMYLIGKTGMGKSTILENMIVDDIRAGHGVAVVDPHGDLAEKIVEYIPADRIKDVVYFNPSDINFPIAFNVVEQVEPHLRHLVASGLIGVFQKLWADSWGPRLEYILRNAILAILDFPGSTLMGVVRMLSDKNYRKKVVANIKDPVVKAFWEKEFSGYADKFASEAVSPIQNKVGQFLSSSLMRNIIGQVKSAIDIRDIMDSGKILIMNLSKGRIGEDNSALLGAMMITKIQLAAMSRVDVPESERRDFYLYIDEFQNFSTDSFANILSEARKYRLNLILAHQYIEQLSEKVKPAVFGNVGTMVVFRVGAADAEELEKEFLPTFTEEDLVNLPKYEMYLKLMIDGIASSPFSAKGLPPLSFAEQTGNTEKVIEYSREKYASEKLEVEEKIMSWHLEDEANPSEVPLKINLAGGPAAPTRASANSNYSPAASRAPQFTPSPQNVIRQTTVNSVNPVSPISPVQEFAPTQVALGGQNTQTTQTQTTQVTQSTQTSQTQASVQAPKPIARVQATQARVITPVVNHPKIVRSSGYEAICASCGQDTTITFVPDGVRPIYCKNCLSKRKEEKRLEVEKRHLAKEIEKKHLEEETVLVDEAPSMSFADLIKAKPVDFRGREIKTDHRTNNSDNQSGAAKQSEHELTEGEDITIDNNQF